MANSPASSRSKDVFPAPLGPVIATARPDTAATSRSTKTSRPPLTHRNPFPESLMMVLFAELMFFRGKLKGGGTGIVDVADDLERLYKTGT
jgi:hypothetical protein